MIIDIHAHLGESALMYLSSMKKFSEPKEFIKLMDANGIDKAIISPIPGYATPEGVVNTRAVNDYIADAVTKYPDRFPCGLAALEPRQGEEKCLEELDRVVNDLNLKGLMFHHVLQGNYLDGPVMYPIVERAAKHDLALLMHTYPLIEEPFRLANLAEAFPDATFVNLHPSTGGESHWEWSLSVSKRCRNVLIDTCFMRHFYGVERAVKMIGGDHIIFGDDLPYQEYNIPSVDLWIVKKVKMSDEDRENILWKNAARIFKLKL